jgi:micrococcal nuclease
MIGVDTPETVKPGTPVQPYGQEASDFTKKMLTGKKVKLVTDVQEKDRYGRLLAYVYLEDGTFYNEYLLQEGYAQVMTIPPNVKYADHFVQVQKRAREQNKGLWGLEPDQSNQAATKPKDTAPNKQATSPSTDLNNTEDLHKLYVDEQGRGLIKGNINSKKEKIYHMPGGQYYDQTNPEEWFKTEQEALDAGFRKSKR